MANPYTSVTVVGYNATPPTDDGVQEAQNQVEWQKHLDKLTDPLKTALEAVDANALAAFASIIANPTVPRQYINGLTLSLAADTDHDISMDSGQCKSREESATISVTSPIIKQIDSGWAEGTNLGGFPSSLSLSPDTWYNFFAIAKPDGTADAGYDSNIAAANLLTDATEYTEFRRVGSVLTDGSSNILKFFQRPGGHFIWDVPRGDVSDPDPGTAAVTTTLSTPADVKVLADLQCHILDTSVSLAGDDYLMFVSDPDMTDTAPSGINAVSAYGVAAVAAGDAFATGNPRVWTNTASQVRYRINRSDASILARINTHGWFDPRGQDQFQI